MVWLFFYLICWGFFCAVGVGSLEVVFFRFFCNKVFILFLLARGFIGLVYRRRRGSDWGCGIGLLNRWVGNRLFDFGGLLFTWEIARWVYFWSCVIRRFCFRVFWNVIFLEESGYYLFKVLGIESFSEVIIFLFVEVMWEM